MDLTNRIEALQTAADSLAARFNPQTYKAQAEKVLQAVAKYPNDWELRHNAGVLLSLANDFPRAREQLREAIRLMPYAADPYFALAGALAFQGRNHEAIEMYEECLRHDPNSFDVLIRLALVESEQSQFAKAIVHLESALRANPESVVARIHLGNAWLQQGNQGKAREQFQEALKIEPGNSEVQRLLKSAGG
jgi:tetratricopeptide (TPR) repeat protein